MSALRIRDQRGMTAVEMLVALSVFAAVIAFTLTAMTSAWEQTLGVDRRLENLAEARVIMNTITKDIRTAARLGADSSPFVSGDDFEVEFYANLNVTTGPRKVRLYVTGGDQLIETTQEPDPGSGPPNPWTYDDLSPDPRIVGYYVANPPSRPLFVYYDSEGTVLPTPLSDDDRLRVEAVEVTLSIRRTTNLNVQPTTIIDRVRLPNVDYNPVPTPEP